MKGLFLNTAFFAFAPFLLAQNISTDTFYIKAVEVQEINAKASFTIDSTVLNDPTTSNLARTLEKNTHVFVKSYGIGSLATVSMRGAASQHTNVLWNGMSLNAVTHGVVDMALYPNLFMDEVQVHYGQASLESGSGALGGAIELKNKVKFQKQQKLTLGQQMGSFNYSSTTLKAEIGDKKWQSATRIMYRTADNDFEYRDIGTEGAPITQLNHANLAQKSLMQSLYFRPQEHTIYSLHYWYYQSDRKLPNLITLKDLEERQYDEAHRINFSFKKYWEKSKFSANLAYFDENLRYENNLQEEASVSNTKALRSFVSYDWEKSKWKLSSRLNANVDQVDVALLEVQEREYISAYSSISYAFNPRISLQAEARQDFYLQEADYFLPSLSLHLQPLKASNWQTSFTAAKNAKYPSLNDLYWQSGGNEQLLAEESEILEWNNSIHSKWKGIDLITHLNFYASDIQNYIQWIPSNRGFWQAENVKHVERRGAELALETRYNKSFFKQNYQIKYNYNQSRNVSQANAYDQSSDRQLIYIPEHQFRINASWEVKDYFMRYDFHLVGARYLTADNTEFLPYYKINDLTLGRRWKIAERNLQLSCSVLNLFNEEYQAIQWRPMPQRNYLISLKLSL